MLFEGAECVTTLLNVGWWKLNSPAREQASNIGRAAAKPAKAQVPLTISRNGTGVPVGVVALGAQGSVLAARAGVGAARCVLHDNEDGPGLGCARGRAGGRVKQG